MIDPFRIATLQAPFVEGAVADNLARMEAEVAHILTAASDTRLILMPELAVTGFILGDGLRDVAQPVQGEHYRRMALVARKHRVHLVYGYVELGDNGNLYDSLILIDDKGEVRANYRKIHLTQLERGHFTPGTQIVHADTALGRIGLLICWDLAFPEMARQLARRGCNLLLASCAWEEPYDKALRRFATARALDNAAYLAVSNTNGACGDLTFFGQSSVYDPAGESITSLRDTDGATCALIDYQYQSRLRTEFYSMLNELRDDIY
jgi:predicted amidohydrolase